MDRPPVLSVRLLQEAPAYGALFYTLGTPECSASISINERPFRVGGNAHSFLDSKRHNPEPRNHRMLPGLRLSGSKEVRGAL
jgi:hypothetical protein